MRPAQPPARAPARTLRRSWYAPNIPPFRAIKPGSRMVSGQPTLCECPSLRSLSGMARRPGVDAIAGRRELVAYRPGIVMVQVVEDGKGLLPGLAHGLGIPAGPVGFTQADQGVRAEVKVVGVGVSAEGLLVESDCLTVAARLMVAVAEALKGCGFTESVAGLALQFQCCPAVGERSLVVAEQRVIPADPVERSGFPGLVACCTVQPERARGMIERPAVVSAGLADARGSALAGSLAGLVAELAVQAEGDVQVI